MPSEPSEKIEQLPITREEPVCATLRRDELAEMRATLHNEPGRIWLSVALSKLIAAYEALLACVERPTVEELVEAGYEFRRDRKMAEYWEWIEPETEFGSTSWTQPTLADCIKAAREHYRESLK